MIGMSDGETDWKDAVLCPDDGDRPGGRRTWRLRLRPEITPGQSYALSGPNAVPEPRETEGRRTFTNNSGWIEAGTNREVWPTHYAPSAI